MMANSTKYRSPVKRFSLDSSLSKEKKIYVKGTDGVAFLIFFSPPSFSLLLLEWRIQKLFFEELYFFGGSA